MLSDSIIRRNYFVYYTFNVLRHIYEHHYNNSRQLLCCGNHGNHGYHGNSRNRTNPGALRQTNQKQQHAQEQSKPDLTIAATQGRDFIYYCTDYRLHHGELVGGTRSFGSILSHGDKGVTEFIVISVR